MPDKSTDEAPKKKGKIGKILIFVIGGLSLVGVGLGVGYVLFGLSAPTPSEEIDIIIERKLQESGQLPAPEDATAEDAEPARQTKPVEAEPTFITSCGDICDETPHDAGYAWEWWYKFQVTDNISVTPALYYLSQTAGQLGKANDSSVNNFGGLIKTTFKF